MYIWVTLPGVHVVYNLSAYLIGPLNKTCYYILLWQQYMQNK